MGSLLGALVDGGEGEFVGCGSIDGAGLEVGLLDPAKGAAVVGCGVISPLQSA